jgi:hypothetical protein
VFSLLWALVISTMPESIKVSIYWINPNSIIHIYIYIYIYSNFQKHLLFKKQNVEWFMHSTRHSTDARRYKKQGLRPLGNCRVRNIRIRSEKKLRSSEAKQYSNRLHTTDYTQPASFPHAPLPRQAPPTPPKVPQIFVHKKRSRNKNQSRTYISLYYLSYREPIFDWTNENSCFWITQVTLKSPLSHP